MAAYNLGGWHGIVVLPHEDDFENEEDDVENDKDVENDDNCALVVPLVKRQVATHLAGMAARSSSHHIISLTQLSPHREEDKDTVIKRE